MQEQGERDAVREVAFLWYLFLEVNARFGTERRSLFLNLAFLSSTLGHWFRDGERARSQESLALRLSAAMSELSAWQQAIAMLRERYFCGVTPLLAEAEGALDWAHEMGEDLVVRFNDHLELVELTSKGRPSVSGPITQDAVENATRPAALALARELVDLARAKEHHALGRHREAVTYIERHF